MYILLHENDETSFVDDYDLFDKRKCIIVAFFAKAELDFMWIQKYTRLTYICSEIEIKNVHP